jgi:hypothetical protein
MSHAWKIFMVLIFHFLKSDVANSIKQVIVNIAL